MKTIIAVLLGLIVGVVGGAGAMHQWLMPRMLEVNTALLENQQKLDALKAESAGALDKLARLEKERAEFGDKLDAAYARLEPAPVAAVAPGEPELAAEAVAEEETPAETGAEAAPPEGERRGDREGRWGGTEEEREARRQEFVTRMQDNMANFFTGELERSATPQMQERLVALEQKTQEMFDLRNQMRQAETDEDREALGQAYGEAMQSARQMMAEHQQDMLGAIATQFGISKEADQVAFEQAVRAAISSPFFNDNPSALLWNAGRSDEGGPGGFGGGGFRGPGGGFGGRGGR